MDICYSLFSIRYTFPSRIHRLGNVRLRHLGEIGGILLIVSLLFTAFTNLPFNRIQGLK